MHANALFNAADFGLCAGMIFLRKDGRPVRSKESVPEGENRLRGRLLIRKRLQKEALRKEVLPSRFLSAAINPKLIMPGRCVIISPIDRRLMRL